MDKKKLPRAEYRYACENSVETPARMLHAILNSTTSGSVVPDAKLYAGAN